MRRQLKVWVFFKCSFSLVQFNAEAGSEGVGHWPATILEKGEGERVELWTGEGKRGIGLGGGGGGGGGGRF
jgi:hypothetical protein